MTTVSTRPRGAWLAATAAISLATAVAAPHALAAGPAPAALPTPAPILTSNTLLGQALANECFAGIGIDYPPINPDGTCPTGKPKTNESYIWGLTEESGKLWFGTMANTGCILDGLDSGVPGVNALFVCEFGESQYARTFPSIPASLGDWRPPSIYSYDLATNTLEKRQIADQRIQNTLGFRGAGSIDNIAFLGGQSMAGNTANLFAFRADNGKYLGSCSLGQYNYVRKWAVVDGVLYLGAGSPTHGAILRWNGSASSFPGNFCAQFSEVGTLTADAANVTLYVDAQGQNRLAASTVAIHATGDNSAVASPASAQANVLPSKRSLATAPPPGSGAGVGVWISPPIPAGGLTPADASKWRQIWGPQQYDPDTIVGQYGYSGGAVQYYQGWLYWGTIHLQNNAAIRVTQKCTQPFCFGVPTTPEETEALRDGVYRTASLWRGRNLENPQTREIQLLYGETQLPACCSAPKTFSMQPTGWTPLFGPSGFGNTANEYMWQMTVFDNRLFVGTYDASILQGIPGVGADLWRFDSADTPAINENYTGLGDPLNYGVRALVTLDDQSGVIAGMADPFNLQPGGGWELRLLKKATTP
jgi:hypothetical protein